MKKLFIIIFVTLSSLPSQGQDDLNTKWILSIDFGIQEHDKRLFDFPKFPAENLLEMQPETFGTYQFGISASRKILYEKRIEVFVGGGLSSELSTFLRPFDYTYNRNDDTKDLLFTNRYYQCLMQLPIKSTYQVVEKFDISLEILPQFNFLTIADNSTGKGLTYSWWRFDFYSIEVNPGLVWTTSKFDFGLKYRVFQFKTFDMILFNNIVRDPRTDQTFETENPFKLWLSIGYKL